MGKLMGLALMCTMAAAVLFQPALMGPPRQKAPEEPQPEPEPAAAPAKTLEPAGWAVARADRLRSAARGRAAAADASGEREKDEAVSHETRR